METKEKKFCEKCNAYRPLDYIKCPRCFSNLVKITEKVRRPGQK